jgi:hypothetical protein
MPLRQSDDERRRQHPWNPGHEFGSKDQPRVLLTYRVHEQYRLTGVK